MRVLGFPLVTPDALVTRIASDLGALAGMARAAPQQFDRVLELGGELTQIGHRALALGERIDARAEAILDLGQRIDDRAEAILAIGERIDARADSILALGERLDQRAEGLLEVGASMGQLAEQIDARGAEIVERATVVSETGAELVNVIPTLERAIEMTTPLEGAIDRFGRLVDRLPGGAARRRPELGGEIRSPRDPLRDPTDAPPDDLAASQS